MSLPNLTGTTDTLMIPGLWMQNVSQTMTSGTAAVTLGDLLFANKTPPVLQVVWVNWSNPSRRVTNAHCMRFTPRRIGLCSP